MEVFKRFVKWIQYVEYSMVIWFYRVFILRLEISIIGNLDYRCSIGWRRSQVADITPGQYYFSFSHVLCYQQASLNLWSIQNTQRGFLYQMHLHEALATRCTLLAPCCTIVTSPKDQFVRFCVSCRWKTGQWHAIDNRICCRCITLLNGGPAVSRSTATQRPISRRLCGWFERSGLLRTLWDTRAFHRGLSTVSDIVGGRRHTSFLFGVARTAQNTQGLSS